MVPVPEVVFHDLECAAEAADLELWRELAAEAKGAVLELGCGTGRVGIRLAREGNEVIGIERSAPLAGVFNERAQREGLPAQAIVANARRIHLRRHFSLVIAPMQLIQQAGDASGRMQILAVAEEHLPPGGRAAFAIVEAAALADDDGIPAHEEILPDIRELHGWVFSSRPLGVKLNARGAVVERLRQRVDPRGEIIEETHTDTIDSISAAQLEEEAEVAGLKPQERRELAPAYGYAPSTVVILEKP